MENPQETEVINRWQATEQDRQDKNTGTGSRKRPRRAIENGTSNGSISFVEELADSSNTNRSIRKPTSKKRVTNSQSSNGRTGAIDLDEGVEEVSAAIREGVLGFFTRR